MSEIESAIGINELKRINKKITVRKKNFKYFISKIQNLKNFIKQTLNINLAIIVSQ